MNYQGGLGNVESGDFFLGLNFLWKYTSHTDTCMKLKLAPWKLQYTDREAMYDSFSVSSAKENYRMNYFGYNGTLLFDILSVMKKQMFSTFDQDNDKYVGNCAMLFGGGNWFNSCQKSNIFGPYKKKGTSIMCSQGLDKSQGDMCSPLTSVQMLLKKKRNVEGSKTVVFSTIASKSCSEADLKLFTVPMTGLYVLTVGGAPGGKSAQKQPRPGGRGARVRAEVYLKKGSVIGTSGGCPGKPKTYAGGAGGDASWVVDRSKGILLISAGGGGGAGDS